ncbi:hypothetical protein T459_35349 [Capsicum annuum]|uniref:TF-B3 domain-containing protein n=1 Tax=Capsicum annuum TaxID=4072 RepID=A0A2G2XTN8_CAPAN|nr:hypothetical protein T459_35349 [Capsicum annuum]
MPKGRRKDLKVSLAFRQPKRHLLTTGWSMFVGAKCLRAGDFVLFIRDEKSQLLLGVRWANCQQTSLPSSVLSADSMHIGVLAVAAHATANREAHSQYSTIIGHLYAFGKARRMDPTSSGRAVRQCKKYLFHRLEMVGTSYSS